MRQMLVVGNWKMHGDFIFASRLLEALDQATQSVKKTQIAICPPTLYLSLAKSLLSSDAITLGAQDVSGAVEDQGAYTGEISARMLKDAGCEWSIVGHSERRQHFKEDNALLASKIRFLQQSGLTPILCVGETLQERESDQAHSVVSGQLKAIIDELGIEVFKQLVVAYEPVWAIGTGLTATPDIAQTMHQSIRQLVTEHDESTGQALRILYGGSVKPDNATELFSMRDIDGALVGGACLEAESFSRIISAAELI